MNIRSNDWGEMRNCFLSINGIRIKEYTYDPMLCMRYADVCLVWWGISQWKVCKLYQVWLGFAGDSLLGVLMMIGLWGYLGRVELTSRPRDLDLLMSKLHLVQVFLLSRRGFLDWAKSKGLSGFAVLGSYQVCWTMITLDTSKEMYLRCFSFESFLIKVIYPNISNATLIKENHSSQTK